VAIVTGAGRGIGRCEALAEGVSGQLIGVMGKTALVWTGREQANEVSAPEGVWTLPQLDPARSALFEHRSSDVPGLEGSL